MADSVIGNDNNRVLHVVSQHVWLKKRGSDRWIGICPFHVADGPEHPSLNVCDNLNVFKCFNCGEAGDADRFRQLLAQKPDQPKLPRVCADKIASALMARQLTENKGGGGSNL